MTGRCSLGLGLLLMFVLTWPIDLASAGLLPFAVPKAMALLVGWGFVAASLLATAVTLGKDGVVSLARRFLAWRAEWWVYLATFLLYPALMMLSVLVAAAVGGYRPDFSSVFARQIFGPTGSLWVFVVPLFVFNAIINGEEIGWRGYVLPRIQATHSALTASIVVGAIWGLWHLPKFLGSSTISIFPLFVVKTGADAVLYTWMYNNSKGSLLVTTLFHSSGNTAGAFLPIANTLSARGTDVLVTQIVLTAMTAAVLVLTQGPRDLSRRVERQVMTVGGAERLGVGGADIRKGDNSERRTGT